MGAKCQLKLLNLVGGHSGTDGTLTQDEEVQRSRSVIYDEKCCSASILVFSLVWTDSNCVEGTKELQYERTVQAAAHIYGMVTTYIHSISIVRIKFIE